MEPLGFIVSCTSNRTKIKPKVFNVKIYSIMPVKPQLGLPPRGRFRLYKEFGEFNTFEQAAKEGEIYAKDHGFPYAWYIKHNKIAPQLIWSWYFKEPPIKIES